MSWPTFPNPDHADREYPYRFLMQIDLATVSRFDLRGLLPKAGHLYFFAHWQDEDPDFDAAGEESRVVFADPGTALRPCDPPGETADFRVYRPRGLSPALQWTVPASCEAGFEAWQENTPWGFFEDVEARIERVGAFASERTPKHRLLGYADFIQSPGLGEDTELLAQVGTDPVRTGPEPLHPADMLWGDAGTIYYLIDRKDLAARRFDLVWTSVEMC